MGVNALVTGAVFRCFMKRKVLRVMVCNQNLAQFANEVPFEMGAIVDTYIR
jgi:hypothetical protein